jgi:hypothetical protein
MHPDGAERRSGGEASVAVAESAELFGRLTGNPRRNAPKQSTLLSQSAKCVFSQSLAIHRKSKNPGKSRRLPLL